MRVPGAWGWRSGLASTHPVPRQRAGGCHDHVSGTLEASDREELRACLSNAADHWSICRTLRDRSPAFRATEPGNGQSSYWVEGPDVEVLDAAGTDNSGADAKRCRATCGAAFSAGSGHDVQRAYPASQQDNGRVIHQHCCEMMTRQAADWDCDMHADRFSCADALIDFIAKFREYGIIIHDGGSSHIVISYCPWCGARLPDSQRERWFDELEALGIDPRTDDVPGEFDDDRWLGSAQ